MGEQARPYAGASREARQSARRERLIDAGIALFGTSGFRAATVGGVCDTAGLNKRYFYESFATLEDLLCAVYEVVVADLKQSLFSRGGDDPLAVVRGFIDGFLGWVQDNPVRSRVHLFEVLGVSERVDGLYRSYARSVGDELCDRLAATIGVTVDGRQRRFLGDALVGAGIQIAVDWVISDYDPPREQLLDDVDGMFGALLASS
ncbi:MAG TPA: TetR/AcrR family transcriptional regulator [Flexivirga sp.]|uniref:TetR/AcrR family transcriptional regulator n=1 Tax=Flexivirga sp. TaxID=1962927 RepID=UPI002C557B74|nr:TetR/AcrR family transcriptional regulator [Flexivirga sp.]HWC22801.1 TetR/AcrR family transcriptional regulator [Flexivirga sp.]